MNSNPIANRPPSVSRLIATFRRFPFALAASALATFSGLMFAGAPPPPSGFKTLLATSLLVFPLLISTRLLAEKKRREDFRPDALTVIVAAAGCLYLILLNGSPDYGAWNRHVLWTVAAYLVLLLVPFFRHDELDDWWHFNASLVHAFVIACIWAFVLFAGILAALSGVGYLFAVRLPSESYLQLGIIMAGFVAVLIFLSNLPEKLGMESHRFRPTKVFGGFIRFVLVPLVALYLLILYIYAVKIILEASWPKGGVAGFILGFSGFGIVTYLLSHGMTGAADSLQGVFRRLFFPFVLPLTAMLFLSVWRRISEYGFTEARYFGIVAALWLAAISLYYILSRRKDLRIVPFSLCLVILVISLGPWGVLSTSARSQTARLERLLQDAGILVNGVVQSGSHDDKPQLLGEINRTVTYLHKIGRVGPLITWSGGKIGSSDTPKVIVTKLGISRASLYNAYGASFIFSAQAEEATDVSGYGSVWEVYLNWRNRKEIRLAEGNTTVLAVKSGAEFQQLTVSGADGQQDSIDITKFMDSLLEEFPDQNRVLPRRRMTIDLPNTHARMVISSISGVLSGGKPSVNSINGFIMWQGRKNE